MINFSLILFALIFLLTGCPKKDISSVPESVVSKENAIGKKEVVTDRSFDKKSNVSSIEMVSLSTGKTVSLGSFKGKITVIDFWASWCVPCIEMFPVFNELKKKMEDETGKVKVISINLDPLPAKAKKIMEEKNVEFEVLKGPESLINAGVLMPFTAIADESGEIFVTANGKHTYEELIKLIEGEKE